MRKYRLKLIKSALFCAMIPIASVTTAENSARFNIDSSVKVMNVNSGGAGCQPGQMWHVPFGRCSAEVNLGTESAGSETSSTACPAGQTGSITKLCSCTRPKYGWITPERQVIRYGSKSCNNCTTISNTCKTVVTEPTPSPTPSKPAPGTTSSLISGNLICDSRNSLYSLGKGTNNQKNQIIAAYRAHKWNMGRCPEQNVLGYDGWIYWQNHLPEHSIDQITDMIGKSTVPKSEQQRVVDSICRDAATKKYTSSGFVRATYVHGSGNECSVLH